MVFKLLEGVFTVVMPALGISAGIAFYYLRKGFAEGIVDASLAIRRIAVTIQHGIVKSPDSGA